MSTITVASTGSIPELYKTYQTRNNATPRALPVKTTGNVQKSKLTSKPLTPVLQLSETECTAGQKTSSIPFQEVRKASMNTMAANLSPNPLYDDLADDDGDNDSLQSLHCHHLTSNGQKVLKELTKLPPETGCTMEFHGVDALGIRSNRRSAGKDGPDIKAQMPSAIHEAFFDCLKLSLGHSIAAMPYNSDLIFPMIHMNSSLSMKRKSVTPDICITVTPAEGPTKTVLVPFVGECMCSEDKAHAINKLKNTIAAHPHVKMAVLGLVHEAQPYRSPDKNSVASQTLGKCNEALPLNEFITKCFLLCTPIRIAHHNWCHISSVELFVWVRGDDEPILDLDNKAAEHMAHGTLLRDVNMDAVKSMLKRGLEKIRDSFVAFSKELDPAVDCTELEEAIITLPLRWKDYLIALNNGADVTALTRYKNWHKKVIKD
ncbi:hypothetical protein BD769DRAFT_1670979 [Suillus cothurnatus]|nr:hypothetical protein BD769DRAFT_1670979 [Suillus cothurnatus]